MNTEKEPTNTANKEVEPRANMLALIADDDGPTRECFSICLKNAGLNVLEAVNGQEVVDIALSKRPDIILLDSMLKDFDGFECLRALREDAYGKKIPVIVCSGDTRREYIIKCAQAGANEFLVKPVEIQTMLEKIVQVLNRCAGKDPATEENTSDK